VFETDIKSASFRNVKIYSYMVILLRNGHFEVPVQEKMEYE